MEHDLLLWFLCGCYFIGGITIGLFGGMWYSKKREGKTGTGRWDYKDRHLGDGGFNE